MEIKTISDFRKAMRHGPYAWPGGYPLYFVLSDGEALSFADAKHNRRLMLEALTSWRDWSDWRPVALEINWEDAELRSVHSGELIESAYGWSGEPDPADPDNAWIDDKTGERKPA